MGLRFAQGQPAAHFAAARTALSNPLRLNADAVIDPLRLGYRTSHVRGARGEQLIRVVVRQRSANPQPNVTIVADPGPRNGAEKIKRFLDRANAQNPD